MSEDPGEPLSPALRALLEHERVVPPVDAELVSRLHARVASSIGIGGGGGGPRATGRPPGGAGLGGASGLLRGVALVGLGAVAGAGAHAVLTAPHASPVAEHAPARENVTPAAMAAPAASTRTEPSVPTPSPTVATEPPPSLVAPSVTHASRDHAAGLDDLAQERGILDVARSALEHGEPDGALAAADRHARLFPHGQLSDMREALAIQALVAANREPDARARAVQFERDYPLSLMRPAVEAALRSR